MYSQKECTFNNDYYTTSQIKGEMSRGELICPLQIPIQFIATWMLFPLELILITCKPYFNPVLPKEVCTTMKIPQILFKATDKNLMCSEL